MYSWKYLLLPFVVPVLVCGCRSTGFDRVALREQMGNGAAIQVTEPTITEVRGLKAQLQFPCRIAVYLKPSNSHDWRWSPNDKAAMDQWIAAIRREGIASEVFALPDMLAGQGGTKDLRVAAAQCGADALFVIQGAAQTDSYKNFASVFNLTLVGGYVVPGSHKDSLFVMEGVLLDVNNGYVYAGVQAEGVGKVIGPTFVVEEKDSISLAKAKAVAQFGEEVVKRMRSLAAMQRQPQVLPSVAVTNSKEPATPAGAASNLLTAGAAAVIPPEKPTGLTSILSPAEAIAPAKPVPAPTLPVAPVAPPAPPKPTGLTTGITTAKPDSK